MPTNPLNPRIMAVVPKKEIVHGYDHTCEDAISCSGCSSEGYNRAIDEVISVLSTLDLGVVPSEKEIYLAMEDRLKKVNKDFNGFIFITDNMYTPPNNWTRVPLTTLAKAVLMLNETKAGMGEKK